MIIRMIFLLLGLFSLSACFSNKVRELKSPCVANEVVSQDGGTPCIRRPANNWLS